MAGSPGGRSVDRISVTVLPDTSKFGRSLERYLQRIERSLRIQIPTELDLRSIDRDVTAVKKRVAAEPAIIPLGTNDDEFARRVKAQVAKIAREAEANIPLTADGEQLRRDLKAQVTSLEKMTRLQVPLNLDMASKFRQDVLAQVAEVERLAQATNPKVSVDTEVADMTAEVAAAVRRAERAAPKIKIDVDRNNSLSTLTSVIGQIQVGAAKVGAALATWGPLIAGAAVVAADLIATIGPGMAVTVPAVLALGAAFGVVKLGGDRLAKSLKPIAKGFEDMKDSIGEALSKGVRPLAQEFARGVLPTIEAGLKKVAAPLRGVVKDMLRWAASGTGVSLIRQLLDGIGEALEPLRRAVTPFVDSLARIGIAAGPGLKLVTQQIEKMSQRFSDFITKSFRDGSLETWITDSVTATGKLLSALGNLGKAIFGTFADIGKGSTNSFADTVNSIATSIQKFNEGGGGKAIHDFIVGVFDALKNVNWEKLKTDLQEVFTNTQTVVQGAQSVAGAIQTVVTTIGGFVAGVQGAWTSITTGTTEAWTAIKTSTTEAWTSVKTTITGAWQAVQDKTTAAWAAISAKVAEAWASVRATVTSAATTVRATVSGAWDAVRDKTTAIWTSVRTSIANAVAAVITAVQGIPPKVSAAWTSVVAAFDRGVDNAVEKVRGLKDRITSFFSNAGEWLRDAGSRVVQGLIDGITSKIGALASKASELAGMISRHFPGSPVKEGPLKSWNNGGAGKRLVEMLAVGLRDTAPLDSSVNRLAGRVNRPDLAAVASGAGAGSGGVNVYVTNPVPETASESTTRIMRRLAIRPA